MRYVISFLIILFSLALKSQSPERCLQVADDYYAIGEYQEAISLYRRVLYFDESLAARSYLHIGESYLAIKQFESARYYYKLALQRANNDSLKNEVFFRRIASYVLEDRCIYAKNELLSFDDSQSFYFQQKSHFYNGVVAYKLNDFDEAQTHFSYLFDEEQQVQLEDFIQQGRKIAAKKPGIALIMSAFVPGLGQAYSNEWEDAANSFFLNILTTTLYVYVWNTYSYIDAVIAVLPWWHRYYVGGFMNARNMVRDKRDDKMDAVLTDILMFYALMIPE